MAKRLCKLENGEIVPYYIARSLNCGNSHIPPMPDLEYIGIGKIHSVNGEPYIDDENNLYQFYNMKDGMR